MPDDKCGDFVPAMRILHTSDWHLGKLFEGHHLTEDQAYVLDDFVALARDTKPDIVIIAGDLYDRSVPPHDAVSLFSDVLNRLVRELKLPTLAIAGNHDSSERIDFGSELLKDAGLVMTGNPLCSGVLTLEDTHGAVDFVPIPFATPEALRSALRASNQDADVQGFGPAMQRQVEEALQRSPNPRRVAIAHAFVTGGHTSESERDLQVGGTGDVAAQVFDPFLYTALGHLHRPQWIDKGRRGEAIRYSGSLLPYSFSEIDQPKSVTLVELGANGVEHTEYPTLRAKRQLRKLTGTFDEILQAAREDTQRDDYIWAEIQDTGLVLQAMPRLRELYPNAVKLTRSVSTLPSLGTNQRDIRQSSPRDIVHDFWRDIGEEEALTEAQTTFLDQAIERARGEKDA